MIIYLYKRPEQKNTVVKFLIIFLVILVLFGSIRAIEKRNAEDFFNGSLISFPTESHLTGIYGMEQQKK